jgi:aspartate kinase
MEQMRNANIPLRLKNVNNQTGNGTIIYPSENYGKPSPSITPPNSAPGTPEPPPLVPGVSSFMSANGYYGQSRNRRTPTALTTKDSIVLLNIQSNRQIKSHGFLAQVFNSLDQRNVVVDLITSSEQSVSFALESFDEENDLVVLTKRLEKFGTVSTQRFCSIPVRKS